MLPQGRRAFIRNVALLSAFFTVRGAFAEALVRTPAQTEGPFYPDHLPLDTDNDLLIVNNSITPAVGEITWLNGRVLDARGEPIRAATVEIWQVDHQGIYLHSRSGPAGKRDKNFQGYGRFLTASSGEYQFRTIKPIAYTGRAPHIHFAVHVKGQERFVTQCYVAGDARNERDGVFSEISDSRARDAVLVPFVPLKNSKAGELSAKFDIVLGFTPKA